MATQCKKRLHSLAGALTPSVAEAASAVFLPGSPQPQAAKRLVFIDGDALSVLPNEKTNRAEELEHLDRAVVSHLDAQVGIK